MRHTCDASVAGVCVTISFPAYVFAISDKSPPDSANKGWSRLTHTHTSHTRTHFAVCHRQTYCRSALVSVAICGRFACKLIRGVTALVRTVCALRESASRCENVSLRCSRSRTHTNQFRNRNAVRITKRRTEKRAAENVRLVRGERSN